MYVALRRETSLTVTHKQLQNHPKKSPWPFSFHQLLLALSQKMINWSSISADFAYSTHRYMLCNYYSTFCSLYCHKAWYGFMLSLWAQWISLEGEGGLRWGGGGDIKDSILIPPAVHENKYMREPFRFLRLAQREENRRVEVGGLAHCHTIYAGESIESDRLWG